MIQHFGMLRIGVARSRVHHCTYTASCLSTSIVFALLMCASGLAATNEITQPFDGVRVIHSISSVPRLVDMYVIEIDMGAPGLSFLVSPSNGVLPGETAPQTTRDFTTQFGAQVGINGSFYDFADDGQLDVLGLAVSNGDTYSQFERQFSVALNISPENVPTIFRAPSRGTPPPPASIFNAVTGNLQLVTDGQNTAVSSPAEPRTAVGVTADGKLLLFTVDGRNPLHSNGLTYSEMADVLIRWGVRNAINLDGGTSTTLVMDNPLTSAIDPGVINVPSDGFESAVANNFAVFAKPKTGPSEKSFVFADFEQGDKGTFNAALSSSSSTRGIDGSLSSADAVSGGAFEGRWSQRLTIKDDPNSSGGPVNPDGAWLAEHLSGAGDPANNVNRPLAGLLEMWVKTTNPDLRISPLIDVSGELGSERGIQKNLIADGQWHTYSWLLTEAAQWESAGSRIGGTFTLHSIQIFGPPESSASHDAIVYLDSISQVIPAQVPEPNILAMFFVAMPLIAACRRRPTSHNRA